MRANPTGAVPAPGTASAQRLLSSGSLPGVAGHTKARKKEALLSGGPQPCWRGKRMIGNQVYLNTEAARTSARPNSFTALAEADHGWVLESLPATCSAL